MPDLVIIILIVIGFVAVSAFLVYLIKDNHRYNQRESLRTLKLQKLEHWNETRDEHLLKEIDEIDRQMEKMS